MPAAKKPKPKKTSSASGNKAYATQAKARKEAMAKMTPAQRKRNDQLVKFGKDVLYPAATFAIPALKGAKVASAVVSRKAVVAKAASAAKKATKPGATSKGASKLTERAANSTLDPSRRFYIDKRTAARYDLDYNLVKGGRKPLVAKEAVKKVTKNVKNSPAAADVKNKNLKNYRKKFGK